MEIHKREPSYCEAPRKTRAEKLVQRRSSVLRNETLDRSNPPFETQKASSLSNKELLVCSQSYFYVKSCIFHLQVDQFLIIACWEISIVEAWFRCRDSSQEDTLVDIQISIFIALMYTCA